MTDSHDPPGPAGVPGAPRRFASPTGFDGTITEALPTARPSWPHRARPASGDSGPGAPDVIVMLVDDMGYSDIGPFGSEIPTPHLDAVAAEGARLTDFHVTPTCSPTRASLLTGCNSHAVGMGAVANVDTGFPGYAAELPPHQPTMAEAFRDAGYATMAIGKWHLCREQDMHAAGDRRSWPLQRGFEQYYGFLEAQANLHAPAQLYEGNSPVHVTEYPEGYYLTDDLTDRAVSMIAESHASDPGTPLMMYFAHAAVHSPMHVKSGAAEPFRGRYDIGWEAVRAERRRRQDRLGVMPAAAGTSPLDDETSPDVPAWDSLPDDGRRLAARHMENYAAMIAGIDESVGRIRDVQRRLGRLENTIFVFLSDNGASGGGAGDVGIANFLSNLDRTRTLTTDERIAEEIGRVDELGGPTTWPQYATAWATVSNTPFRRHKFSTYRGGHQVSFLLSWPAGLGPLGTENSGTGAVRHQYAHVTDLLPTLAELAGVPVPAQRGGLAARPLDGTSIVTALRDGGAPSAHGDQYYECLGERAYYAGDFEVVAQRTALTPFSEDRWALYRPGEDPVQLNDLADMHPGTVDELVSRWEDAAEAGMVYPMSDGGPLHFLQRDPAEQRLACETVLIPETPALERFRASRLIDGRSFTVEVDLGADGYRPGDEGVLVAHGGQEAGYVLYILDGAVHLEQNAWGRTLTVPPAPVPAGARVIGLRIDAPGRHRWTARLTVDDAAAVEGADLVALSWLVPFSGLAAGTMSRSPVSWSLYRAHGMFPYTGPWETVTYRPGDYAPDAPAVMLDAIRRMGAATQ